MAEPSATMIDDTRPPMGERVQAYLERLRSGDEIAHLVTFIFAGSILLVTGLLVFELWRHSALSLERFGWAFLVTRTWDPLIMSQLL